MWQWVRFPKAGAALAFFLPWITVSCSGQKIGSASGWDLATGKVAFTNPMTGLVEHHAAAPNALLVMALLLILVGLALSFADVRKLPEASVAVFGTSVIAGVLTLAATLRINGPAVGQALPGASNASVIDTALIRVETAFGFWLTCLALGASGALAWLAMTGRSALDAEGSPPAEEDAEHAEGAAPARTKTCPVCGRRASGDATVCAIDGTELV